MERKQLLYGAGLTELFPLNALKVEEIDFTTLWTNAEGANWATSELNTKLAAAISDNSYLVDKGALMVVESNTLSDSSVTDAVVRWITADDADVIVNVLTVATSSASLAQTTISKFSTSDIPEATTSAAGLMSAADKSKLDSLTITGDIDLTDYLTIANAGVGVLAGYDNSSATGDVTATDTIAAGLAKVEVKANNAATVASAAQSAADAASSIASTAQSTAEAAQSAAQTAQSTADEAKTAAEAAQAAIDALETTGGDNIVIGDVTGDQEITVPEVPEDNIGGESNLEKPADGDSLATIVAKLQAQIDYQTKQIQALAGLVQVEGYELVFVAED